MTWATLRRILGLPAHELMRLDAALPLPPREPPVCIVAVPRAFTNQWSPLARLVIAINIDRTTPGGLR